MISTVSVDAETASKLTLKLNDWLKGWNDEQILDIQFVYRDAGYTYPCLAFVTYKK